VLLAAEGLHPSSKGARIKFSGGKRTVIDGPFTETKELVAGFWIIQVKSKAEAIEWASRVPFADDGVIEVRQVLEASDFPPGSCLPRPPRASKRGATSSRGRPRSRNRGTPRLQWRIEEALIGCRDRSCYTACRACAAVSSPSLAAAYSPPEARQPFPYTRLLGLIHWEGIDCHP
jgi:hypothetical protein